MSESAKHKTHTSTAVKARYNAKVYDKITFSAPKELAKEFKDKCADSGVSMAQIFKSAMRAYLDGNLVITS